VFGAIGFPDGGRNTDSMVKMLECGDARHRRISLCAPFGAAHGTP